MAQFEITFDGRADIGTLDATAVRRAASRALNRVARDTRSEVAKRVREEINLPASYVSPSSGRLSTLPPATPDFLQTGVEAARRNTSLARFVSAKRRLGRSGVAVNVKPGQSAFLERAFLLPLPQGFGPTTDGPKNLGLAIRLRKGETLSSTFAAKRIGNRGLYLLYGPAVAQAFENNAGSGIKRDIEPEVEEQLEREFLRLLDLERRNA